MPAIASMTSERRMPGPSVRLAKDFRDAQVLVGEFHHPEASGRVLHQDHSDSCASIENRMRMAESARVTSTSGSPFTTSTETPGDFSRKSKG